MPPPRVIKLAQGEDGPAWAEALADTTWREAAQLLKQDRDTSVWRTQMLGKDVVIKCWELSRFKRRLQTRVNATPAVRQWNGAALLIECKIATATPYVLARGKIDGKPYECLAMEMLPGKSLLEHMAEGDLSVRQEHAVARVLGEQIHEMIQAKLFNRDHKPSNLIVQNIEPAEVALIDTVGVCKKRKVGLDDKMLAALLTEPSGCGCAPRLTLMVRVMLSYVDALYPKDIAEWKLRYQQNWLRNVSYGVGDVVRKHGDSTPKVDPLANVRRSDG